MDDMIGFAVVGIIIAGLTYALIKQIKETKHSGNGIGSPLYRKQLARKNKVMTVALIGVIVFYTLNILSVIASSIPVSNSFTVLGTFLSFFVYFFARIIMKPQLGDQRRNLSLY
ncbi:4-aminobutyrate aminotransferase [Solibacillus sp. NPDC093137]|uniref:4-aminobutyrate aminotransferase n=1 Tax=Solibacillus sp. NPDC093137 TaxID=3390678 RepID=UPI003D018487